MRKEPAIIRLHGELGRLFGKKFSIYGKTVAELMRGLFFNTQDALKRYLIDQNPEECGYKLIINGKVYKKDFDEEQLDTLRRSSLTFKQTIKTIDIVPVLQGAKQFLTILAGVVLIIIGIVTFSAGGGFLIAAGIGLLAAGVIQLLTKPPKFEDFREIDGATGRTSYIFNGPQNTTREGGPVPLVYGQVLVGSQVISASYNIRKIDADPTLTT